MSIRFPVAAYLVISGYLVTAGFAQQSNPVTLEVTPNSLSVAYGESRRVTAIAHISAPVRNLTLQARGDPGTSVTVGKPGELAEEVHSDVSWPISIRKSADGRTSAKIVFLARYERGDKADPSGTLVQTVLELTVKERPKIETVAKATLEIVVDKLEERRPRQAYIAITNLADVPIRIETIRGSVPAFVHLSSSLPNGKGDTPYPVGDDGWYRVYPSDGLPPISIAPRSQQLFQFKVWIPPSKAVLAGKYLMMFETQLQYEKDGYSTENSISTSKEFEASVLGDTEFVGPTGVPFLLLPGFLFVVLVCLLFGKVWPKLNIPFDFKKPEFYLFGIVLSIVNLFVYTPLSPWIYSVLWQVPDMQPRDLFQGYSLNDIINVWVISLVSALLLWTVVGGVWRMVLWIQAQYWRNRTPLTTDEPLDVLHKLVLMKRGFGLNELQSKGPRLWELPLHSPDSSKRWASGRIEVKFPPGTPNKEFEELVKQPSKTAEMYRLLTRLTGSVKISWTDKEKPRLVPVADTPLAPGTDPFIHEDTS